MYAQFAKMLYIHSIIIMVGISSVKISIAFFLLRLTGIASRTPYSRFLYGVVAFIVLLTLGCAGSLIFQCLPIEATWNYMLRQPPIGTGTAKCYSNTVFRNLGLMNSGKFIFRSPTYMSLIETQHSTSLPTFCSQRYRFPSSGSFS